VSAWGEGLLGLLTFAMGVGIAAYSYRTGFRAGVRSQRVSDMGWPSAWRPNATGTAPARCVERQLSPRSPRQSHTRTPCR
jgi:hypothetical protein